MKRHRSFLAVATILSMSLAVSAHDTWLVPRVPIVPPGIETWLLLTSGMSFPLLDTSINPDRVDVARCRLNDRVIDVSERKSLSNALSLGIKFMEPGFATCWVELK